MRFWRRLSETGGEVDVKTNFEELCTLWLFSDSHDVDITVTNLKLLLLVDCLCVRCARIVVPSLYWWYMASQLLYTI